MKTFHLSQRNYSLNQTLYLFRDVIIKCYSLMKTGLKAYSAYGFCLGVLKGNVFHPFNEIIVLSFGKVYSRYESYIVVHNFVLTFDY